MRANKRRELESKILAELLLKRLSVECGECHAAYRAAWTRCVVRNAHSWMAMSEVPCVCGSMLYSYIGDSVPMDMLQQHCMDQEQGFAVRMHDSGPVMSFVKRAISQPGAKP